MDAEYTAAAEASEVTTHVSALSRLDALRMLEMYVCFNIAKHDVREIARL